MSNALASQGTTLTIKVGSAAAVNIGGLKDFSDLGGGQASEIDTTTLASTAKEKMLGLQDLGTVKLSLNYLPKDPGQKALRDIKASSTSATFTFTLSDGTTEAFTAYCSTFATAAGVDQIVTATASLTITGAVTEVTTA